ncbi:hypothetical protein TNCV_2830601 [Trichonephila clavipes]|nr:hypothetical protein TNCV_2830601 [Trichonephila clavipes]
MLLFICVLLRGWFVAALLHSRFRVRPRPKSVDFHDAEKSTVAMSYDYTECKRSLECLFDLSVLNKIKPGTGLHRQSSSASLCGENWMPKLPSSVGCLTVPNGVILSRFTVILDAYETEEQLKSEAITALDTKEEAVGTGIRILDHLFKHIFPSN